MISQGSQIMAAALVMPVLADIWNFNSSDQLAMSAIFFGVTLGALLQQLADYFGRKPFLVGAAYSQAIFGLLSCLAYSY